MGLTPKKMYETLVFMIENKEPVMLVGSPGIGKTEIVRQACEATKRKLVIMHPVVSSSTDFKGLPFLSKDGNSADFKPYGDLRILLEATEDTVFFLDDLGQAPASVQASCILPGTLVLGESYRDIKDIEEGELVIGDDGSMHKVTHKFEHDYDGKLYDISSVNRVPITATEEHPFEVIEGYQRGNTYYSKKSAVFAPVWKKASELVVGEYVGTPIIEPYINVKELYVDTVGSFKRTVKLSNEFARFLGYYVGNGYCVNHPKVTRVNVCFNLAHKDKIDDCRKIMGEIFGKHVFEKIDGNCIHLGIHDKYLKHFFHKHCGDDVYDKKIPEFILYHKNIKYLIEFLKGYFLTDGYLMVDKGKKRGLSYSTVSKKLALQTQMAFTRLGTIPGIKIKPGGKSEFPGGRVYMCKESYVVQVSDSEALMKIGVEKDELRVVRYSFIHDNKIWTRITKIDSHIDSCKVYNLEVEGVNTYTANNYIVHNCMQLLLERRLNNHKVSDKITFIAATNRRNDKAAVQGILEPVKSRFSALIDLEVSVDDWVDWAMKNKMPETIVSFVRFKPTVITEFIPSPHIVNTSCPRTVANVGRLINKNIPESCKLEIITGAAGQAFAIEYIEFSNVYKNIPTFADILRNPSKCILPEKVSEKYAVSGMIAYNTKNSKTFDAVMEYIYRMPMDFQVMIVKDTLRLHKGSRTSKKFNEWASKHSEMILD